MMGHNICFDGEIWLITPVRSTGRILFLCSAYIHIIIEKIIINEDSDC